MSTHRERIEEAATLLLGCCGTAIGDCRWKRGRKEAQFQLARLLRYDLMAEAASLQRQLHESQRQLAKLEKSRRSDSKRARRESWV